MENTTTSPVTTSAVAVRYGLVLSVVWLIIDFALRNINLSFMAFGTVTLLLGALTGVVGIVLAHRFFKSQNGGLMTFGQGFTISLIMMLVVGLISGLFGYVYVHYIDSSFIDRLQASMEEFMTKMNVPTEQLDKQNAQFEEMRNIGIGKSILSGLGNGLFLGVLLGLIVSAITKKNAPEFE